MSTSFQVLMDNVPADAEIAVIQDEAQAEALQFG